VPQNNTDTEISNGKLQLLNLDPPNNGYKDFFLKDGIIIGANKYTYVDVAAHNGGTSEALSGSWVQLIIPDSGGFLMPATFGLLPVNSSHTFQLKFSSLDGIFDEIYCRLYVDSAHVIHLEDLGDSAKRRMEQVRSVHDNKINAIEAFNKIIESSEWARTLVCNNPSDQKIRSRLINQLGRDLHDKLRLGELSAWGRLDSEKPLRPIPQEEWDEVTISFDERSLTSNNCNACAWVKMHDVRKSRLRYVSVQFSRHEISDSYPLVNEASWCRQC